MLRWSHSMPLIFFLSSSGIKNIHRAVFKGMSLPGSLFAFYITSNKSQEQLVLQKWIILPPLVEDSTVNVVSNFVPELWQELTVDSVLKTEDWFVETWWLNLCQGVMIIRMFLRLHQKCFLSQLFFCRNIRPLFEYEQVTSFCASIDDTNTIISATFPLLW